MERLVIQHPQQKGKPQYQNGPEDNREPPYLPFMQGEWLFYLHAIKIHQKTGYANARTCWRRIENGGCLPGPLRPSRDACLVLFPLDPIG